MIDTYKYLYTLSDIATLTSILTGLRSSLIETLYLLDSLHCFNPETISIFEKAKRLISEPVILVGIVATTNDIKSTDDKTALMDAFASTDAKNYIINDAPS
jgi:hypothetical protein